jgi:GT2 family glycosyltransferase
MKISFIIVNYQSEKYLEKCISSIKEKILGVDYEIIVVNNDSFEIQLPSDTKIINVGKNVGFGAGCNIGARKAQGKILCFLNPDTEIVSERIHEFIQEFNDSNIGIIGPKLVTRDNKIQEWSTGIETTLLNVVLNNFKVKRGKKIWESPKIIECDWVSGAAIFVRNDIFKKLRGFDEKFFTYFEDEDLCRRAKEEGYKILYYPDFTVKHFGGISFSSKKEQKKLYYQSQDYYFEKHCGEVTKKILKLLRSLTI